LFQILTGRLPFEGETVVDKLTAKFMQDPPRACDLRSDVSHELSEVLARMIHREADSRPQTPQAAAEALAPFGMSRNSGAARRVNGNGKKAHGATVPANKRREARVPRHVEGSENGVSEN
jgi:hypothetical protein